MKKMIWAICLVLGITTVSFAQNRSIRFEKGTWKEVLKKAKKQKKLVFLDCYTSWCGPCKMLSTRVFTNDTVADYYNDRFIPMKMDMEKGEGVELGKVLEVHAYPTMFYVDGDGKVQHKVVGYRSPRELIEEGKLAYDGERNYAALVKRYEAGEREPSFVCDYLEMLAGGYEQEKLWEATREYLESLDDSVFLSVKTWKYIANGLADPLSAPFRKLMQQKEEFYALVGRETVEKKLESVFGKAVAKAIGISPYGETGPFREAEYERLLVYLKNLLWDGASRCLAGMYMGKCIHEADYEGMIGHINTVLDYNIFGERGSLGYVMLYAPYLENIKDAETVKKAIALIDKLLPHMTHPFYENTLLEQKSVLLESIGRTEEAREAKAAAIAAEERGRKMLENRQE